MNLTRIRAIKHLLPVLILSASLALAPLSRSLGASCMERVNRALLSIYGSPPSFAIQSTNLYLLEIPPELQTSSGIRSITKIDEIGSGSFGTVYRVDVEFLDGSRKFMAWKEVELQDLETETPGFELHHLAVKAAEASSAPNTANHIVKTHSQWHLHSNTGVKGAFLMDLAGVSAHSLVYETEELNVALAPATQIPKKARREHYSNAIRGVAKMAHDISSALAQLNHSQIVHKDIKLDNIVITGGKENTLTEVKEGKAHFGLIDFGISNPVGYTDARTSSEGTPGFVPPERFKKSGSLPESPATDIYATATTLAMAILRRDIWNPHQYPELFAPVPGVKDVAFLSPEKLRERFNRLRSDLEDEKVSQSDLQLYDRMVQFILTGLNPDPTRRMNGLRSNPNSIMRISKSSDEILGPDPKLDLVFN